MGQEWGRGTEAEIDLLRRAFFPQGELSEPACERLLGRFAPHRRTAGVAEIEALICVLETATATPPPLAAFLLRELTAAVIAGEGPAIGQRPHFSRVLDTLDVAFLRRVLDAGGGASGVPVSRAEADALFELHDATASGPNEADFDDLFHRAIASHVLAASGHRLTPRREFLAGALPTALLPLASEPSIWLADCMLRDGRPTPAELKLMRLLGAAHAAPDRSVRRFIDFAA